MTAYSTILVDDNEVSIKVLELMIHKFTPEIDIIGKFTNPAEALVAIREDVPDLIFMDIEMPGMDGFKLKELIDKSDLRVVYVSGHSPGLIHALRVGAFDFLQKPVQEVELIECVKRFKAAMSQTSEAGSRTSGEAYPDKILVNKGNKSIVIEVKDIIYIHASGAYSEINYTNNRNIVSSKPIAFYADLLNPDQMVRTHRSYLINIDHVVSIDKSGNWCKVQLTGGVELEIAKANISKLTQYLKG
ncbi:MAG: response regulator transcription factor [Bacteroidetes bacterium]|nr:response regulator transcription factor [Bacteroidota bacterium]